MGLHTSHVPLKRLSTHAHNGMGDLVWPPGTSVESSSSEDEKGSEITLRLEGVLLARSRESVSIFPPRRQKTFWGQPSIKRPLWASISPLRVFLKHLSGPSRMRPNRFRRGWWSEKHRQEDQCNDPGRSEGDREPEVGVTACQEQGAQWEGSLWKRELGAVILSRLTEIGPGAGTRGHSQGLLAKGAHMYIHTELIYIYVCMYVYIYVSIYVCMYIYMYLYMYNVYINLYINKS